MLNNKKRHLYHLTGALVLTVAGMWAAGLVPLDALGIDPGAPGATPQLKTLSAKAGRRITTLTIETSDPVPYLTNRPDPMTLLVDLRQVDAAGVVNGVNEAKGVIAGVSVEDAVSADGATVARVRIRLTQPAAHQVRAKRNFIYVDLDSAFPLGGPGTSSSLGPAAPSIRFATTLDRVRADGEPTGASVTLTGNGELALQAVTAQGEGTPRVVLDFPNVRSKTPADIVVGQGPISAIHVSTTGVTPSTRVTVDLVRPASYRVIPAEDGGKDLKIIFDDTGKDDLAGGAPPTTVASLGPLGGTTPAGRAQDSIGALLASSDSPVRNLGTAGVPARAPLAQQQPPGPGVPPTPSPIDSAPPVAATTTPSRFNGHPVTLDFQGADLRTVLRTFADISGLNIVIDQSVTGNVDVSLHEVPWDQALDIILKDHKLGYNVDGTIVRIAPITVLADEETQRRKLSEEQALSGELQLLTRPLSYAKANDLTALLTRTALSSRGDIQIDSRTNTIIIRDLASRLQSASQLIDSLDKPQPQVEIEARIVQTTRDFARNLGVQWGFNGRASAALGNTTGLAFPNNGSIQGSANASPAGAPDTAVNLGVSPATSAIGLALGSVNGAFNLDVALSALESSGHGRILSSPRVATQNNVPAEITQGVQIPIQTVANNTVTVTFKDAALKLNVTPQITASNTVIMSITIENASPDFSRAINNIPPIDTQRAVTSILVSDGQTSVIGGIYVSQQQATNDRTPGLHKIPLLGWLFRRETLTDQSRELLIFITPRIIKS
jgi:type IV pilus secretin PilQ/predicted competence protein